MYISPYKEKITISNLFNNSFQPPLRAHKSYGSNYFGMKNTKSPVLVQDRNSYYFYIMVDMHSTLHIIRRLTNRQKDTTEEEGEDGGWDKQVLFQLHIFRLSYYTTYRNTKCVDFLLF